MYDKQEQHIPTVTPDMFRNMPDQVVDILNRLIRYYEQYRDDSYNAITKNVTVVTAAEDVINSIQTDITNIHGEINDLATVATTGSYSDLINKPSIPTFDGIAREMFPVGAVYVNTDNTDPSTFLPGTWLSIGAGPNSTYMWERTA